MYIYIYSNLRPDAELSKMFLTKTKSDGPFPVP